MEVRRSPFRVRSAASSAPTESLARRVCAQTFAKSTSRFLLSLQPPLTKNVARTENLSDF